MTDQLQATFKKTTLPHFILLAVGSCLTVFTTAAVLVFLSDSSILVRIVLMVITFFSLSLQVYSIRELRRSSRRLELQSSVFELLLNSMSSGVVGISTRGTHLFSNLQSQMIGGSYNSDAPSDWAKNFGIFESDQETPLSTESLPIFRALNGEHIKNYVVFVRNDKFPDGAFLTINANPIRGANNEILGAVAVFDDISELKRNEKIVAEQELVVQHSARLSALGSMAGGIAHEISTPLAAISLLSENLGEADSAFDQKMVVMMGKKIRDSVDKIAKLINGLRQFSRDHTKETFELVPLKKIIDDALAFCDRKLEYNSVKVHLDYPKEQTIYTKPSQLTEVLLSLLFNACEAVSSCEEKWIRIEAKKQQTCVEFSISDSGKKIDPLVVKRMFDPFYSTKTVGQGFGLGLSISKRAIEELGGTLLFDSDAQTTKFVVRIPASEEFAPMRAAASQV